MVVGLNPLSDYHTNTWASASDETLVSLFSFFEPEQLRTCGGVCTLWNRVAEDNCFYFQFAKNLKFFFMKNGAYHFSIDAKNKFLFQYKQMLNLQREEGESRYQAIERWQSAGAQDQIAMAWESLLPPHSDFFEFTSSVKHTQFYQLDYPSVKATMTCLMNLGALIFETSLSNRPFFLACYNGDEVLIDRIGEELPTQETFRELVLTQATLMAVVGGQAKSIDKLRSLGTNFYAEIIPEITIIDYVRNIYPEMVPVLEHMPRTGHN